VTGPFPYIEVFDRFLSSLEMRLPTKDDCEVVKLEIAPAIDVDGSTVLSHYWLCYPRMLEVKIDSMRRKLGDVLKSMKHPSSKDICDAILALFTQLPRINSETATDRLNRLLRCVKVADVSEYSLCYGHVPKEVNGKIREFDLGPLALSQLEYRCRKAGSDYFKRYKAKLSRQPFAVSRVRKACVISAVDYWSLHKRSWPLNVNEDPYFLLDHYYHSVSQELMLGFREDLDKAVALPIALGSSSFSLDHISQLGPLENIVIFLGMGGEEGGWVSPTNLRHIVTMSQFHLAMPFTFDLLDREFGRLGESPIDRAITRFSSFLTGSVKLQESKLFADAFLYHVIALDLLLGEQGRSTASVAKRSALLAHGGLMRDFDGLVKVCTGIYDARSKYVHGGEAPDPSLLPLVEEICREVLLSLFRLKARGEGDRDDFHSAWVKRIDLLIAKRAVDEECTDSELRRVGVAVGEDLSYLKFDALRRESLGLEERD
jgi:hypothetical protein